MPRPLTETARGGITYRVSSMNKGLKQVGWKETKANRTRFANGYVIDADKSQTYQLGEIKDAAQALIQGRGAAKKPYGVKVRRPRSNIKKAMPATPPSVRTFYALGLRNGTKELIVNPQRFAFPSGARAMAARSRRNVGTTNTLRGGKAINLSAGDEFKRGSWTNKSLDQIVKDPKMLTKLRQAGYDTSRARDLLVVNTKSDNRPMVLAFKESGEGMATRPGPMPPRRPFFRPGFIGRQGFAIICADVSTFTLDGRSGPPVFARKPVIYLYPKTTTNITVDVKVQGEFVAQYPKKGDKGWEMVATPEGMLFDPKTEKKYSYLFWEATADRWAIDPKQAFCVQGENAESFLETVASKFALNDREKTDFISYWLPALENNELSLVQFLSDEQYENYAHMTVNPQPETTIRLFMIFEKAHGFEKTGNPELPQLERKGYTVVEWGGANLDETKR